MKLSAQIENHICCFFDGAAKSSALVCGARGVLWLTDGRKLKWKLKIGRGTNNKAELTALWATLFIAFREGYQWLQVMGDSRIIIDWLLGSADLQAKGLSWWKRRIRDLGKNFSSIYPIHIFRELNMEADMLSKEALLWRTKELIWWDTRDGKQRPQHHFQVFKNM